MVIMNDGHPTFISFFDNTSSSIDLSIGSRDLRLLASSTTLQDLHGSDFPVSVSVAETSPSTFLFTNRIPLSPRQLSVLHTRLILETPKFSSLIFSSSPPLQNPLQKYELFCSLLTDTMSSFFPQRVLPSQKKFLPCNRLPNHWWNSIC